MMGLNRRIYRKKTPAALALSAGLILVHCSSAPIQNREFDRLLKKPPSDLSRVTSGDGVKLSEAIQKNLKKDEPTGQRLKLIQWIASRYQQKKGSLSEESFESCKREFADARECAFLKPSWSDTWLEVAEEDESDAEIALKIQDRETSKNEKISRKAKQKTLNELHSRLKKGDITPNPEHREGDYYRALKRFQSWTPELAEVSKKLLEQKECFNPEFYNYLGLKAEEYFPSDEMWGVAISLYTKADECAQVKPELASSKYVQSARFRLGLLSVMKNDCNTANQAFTRLAKVGVSDYSTRAHYWTAYCARTDSNRDQFVTSFEELFRTNPLGFHTLTINKGDSHLAANLAQPVDPTIKTRTEKDTSYDTWIALIEDFDRMGNTQAVWKLLAPVRKTPEYLKSLEPRVRLYLSTFAYRSKDTISLFRILDSVFRNQSEYVLDSTLKLFYPMKHFDKIAGQVRGVHPFLITALIRQESAFQENARSRVGAAGLMQLMPRTAKLLDRRVSKKQLYDADTNIRLGVMYFEKLVQRYEGDVELALAAYNAGSEVVDKWAKRYPVKNRLLFLDLIPYAETRNYVTLIGRNYYWYSKLYSELLKQNNLAHLEPNEFRAMKSVEVPVTP